ncbi:HK97 family phage major capsid protein [Pseudaminobacter salicylatoxidans]|uniref:HK97 family phage major capsid protein n=1 Tax=Pseudaminobacter salicylatoxidans TaxID=93369 RepID=A0A316C500_PSESE|nr:phage major capsid protein [Pseudaminobacter salicylatoxidans]PWJ84872.1 HK97 family phage major capsid protein [Pseudaminobacter salicylatoxidans]
MTNLASMISELGDKFTNTTGDLASRLSELEKRAAREPSGDYIAVNDDNPLAAAMLDSKEVQNLTSTFRGKAIVKMTGENAAITSAPSTVGSNTSPGTSLVPAHRVPGIITPYERELRVRDVIGSARTTSNNVEYPRETGFDNKAAPVAEGNKKPQSDITFDLDSAPVRTIAHTFKISRQMLDDVPALAAYVGRRGTYGLKFVEDQQLLFGDGTGQNIHGLVPRATAFNPQFTSPNETSIDRILQAISQAEDADVPVNAVVLSKRDWRKLTGTKDLGGNYISDQAPFGLVDPRVWSLPIVATNAMPVGEFLTGAFGDGAQIFDRLDVEVLISTENEDDFIRNLATVRIEERLALAVYRPNAFVAGDLEPTTP